MTAVPSLLIFGLARQSHHSAITWNVPKALAAWYVTVRKLPLVSSIVPPGQGPIGGVFIQEQFTPLFSLMFQTLIEGVHVEHKP